MQDTSELSRSAEQRQANELGAAGDAKPGQVPKPQTMPKAVPTVSARTATAPGNAGLPCLVHA